MTCTRCGGSCIDRDEDGWRCLQCGRPCNPVVSTMPYDARHVEDIASTIRRERMFIDRQIAAGKRTWS